MLKLNQGEITIALSSGVLHGTYREPTADSAVIVFAHGSGSSRHSPRNLYVAELLATAGFGTLLFDLLTEQEDRVYDNRFDIQLLSDRLVEAVRWVDSTTVGPEVPLALFGASTGAAAALVAAARLGGEIKAVVSRGGRPDLAADALRVLHCPTLFIVGGLDNEVAAQNREAMGRMPADTVKRIQIVPGATHLFEEPGTLQQAAELARDWFRTYAVKWHPRQPASHPTQWPV